MVQSSANLEASSQTPTVQDSSPVYNPNPLSRDARRAAREAARSEGVKADTKASRAPDSREGNSKPSDVEEPRRVDLGELFKDDTDGLDDIDGPIDSVDRASKRLGIKPDEFYNIKIQMKDGAEALTVGELKDRVGELVEFETRETQFNQRRIAAEGRILNDQREVREILAMLPADVVQKLPQLVERVRKKHEATLSREQQLTIEHIPEWTDETVAAKEKAEMTAFLGNWGFDDSFLNTIVDHRAMKFVRDVMMVDKKIKAALAKVTTPDKKGQRPSARTGKPAQKPARDKVGSRQPAPLDQQSRIMAFLNRE